MTWENQVKAHFERHKGFGEGTYQKKKKSMWYMIRGSREAWPEPKATPWSLNAVSNIWKVFNGEEGYGHRTTYFYEPEYSKDERVA